MPMNTCLHVELMQPTNHISIYLFFVQKKRIFPNFTRQNGKRTLIVEIKIVEIKPGLAILNLDL